MLEKMKARSIRALRAKLSDEWYEECEGVYSHVPTWGPETESVRSQIARSCGDGDIVSWDTRDKDPRKHLYLRRTWVPAHDKYRPENEFEIVSGFEYDDAKI